MFVLRDSAPTDLDGLYQLATHLDSVNLPANHDVLREILDLSTKSFGQELPALHREYLFVMQDLSSGALVGTSMIIAQHGTPESPHIFFEVLRDEKYSSTLKLHFVHTVLKIGYSYNGPTEIGGIVLEPSYRGNPHKLGKQLSYVRFLFIARHPERFRRRILAELLPPLEADGTSLLWEAIGRKFTGLSYQEADLISKHNKEFIRTLFPGEGVYASLLPKEAQALIGEVGPETKGVERMLTSLGFEYQKRIDPFDGGPHFSARTEDIPLLRALQILPLDEPGPGRDEHLIAVEREGAPPSQRFACVKAPCAVVDGRIQIPREAHEALGVAPGVVVSALPLTTPPIS